MRALAVIATMASLMPAIVAAQGPIEGATLAEILKKAGCTSRTTEVLRDNRLETRHLKGNLPTGREIDLSACFKKDEPPERRVESELPPEPESDGVTGTFFTSLVIIGLLSWVIRSRRRRYRQRPSPKIVPVPAPQYRTIEHWGAQIRAKVIFQMRGQTAVPHLECPVPECRASIPLDSPSPLDQEHRLEEHFQDKHFSYGRYEWKEIQPRSTRRLGFSRPRFQRR